MAPYRPMTIEEAIAYQHRMVAEITAEIPGTLQLEGGDYGLVPGLGRPRATARVERAIARMLRVEDAALILGAGTGAIRMALMSVSRPGDRVVMHTPPAYPTTEQTMASLGLQPVYVDLNDREAVAAALKDGPPIFYIQTTYQHEEDGYDVRELVELAREVCNAFVLTDDSYAAFKAPQMGCELGADLSAFSLFKAMGPAGLGCVAGRMELVERIRSINYSGGSQVQGPDAMDALRSLVAVPVLQALSYETHQQVVKRWQSEGVPGVEVSLTLCQSGYLLVSFDRPIGERVTAAAARLGALPYPVGAQSRYEISPLFYRPAGIKRRRVPDADRYLVRISANRAGPDLIIDLLKRAIELAGQLGATP